MLLRIKNSLAVLFVMTVGLSTQLSASPYPNGKELLSLCQVTMSDENGQQKFSICMNLITKVRQYFEHPDNRMFRVCIPKDEPDLHLVFAGVNWLQDNPTDLKKGFDIVLARAYARKWPCS